MEVAEPSADTLPTLNFEDVYEEHHRSVYSLCRRLLREDSEAEDATQETFLAVASGLSSFRGESNIATWIHRIAIRVSLRIRSRRRSHMLVVNDQFVSQSGASPFHPADSRRLANALSMLSYEHRLVLALFSIAGFSHQDIAEVLSIPEGTVWSRLHAAKKKIAGLLA